MSDNDIVISGMSGRFPESNNVQELAENLFSGVDMVTQSNGRWPQNLFGVNTRSGKIKDLDLFDADFFKTNRQLADCSDPQLRILLEITYEAIIDAGINPHTLCGTRTGVYIGISPYPKSDGLNESLQPDIYRFSNKKINALNVEMGNNQALIANTISFVYDFKGPSLITDTACSASMTAFNLAFTHLQTGQTDFAIVAGTHIDLNPYTLQLFQELGMCSQRGISAVMDESADGFVKSDTISCLLLQRRSTAKRVYATVLTSRVNSDGKKKEGIYYPSSQSQEELMVMAYKEAGIDPLRLTYVEAHLTGTKVGDPLEFKAIHNAYCSRPGRKDILPIGSLKGNTGHSEGASGVASVIKTILCYERESIPPNINLNELNNEIKVFCPPLYPNRELLKYKPGMAAVNNYGFGGVNCNVLVEPNYKLTNEDNLKIAETIPRIVNICGRTKDAVRHVFDFIEQNPQKITREFLALLTDIMKNVFNDNTNGFPYKGSIIIKKLSQDKSGVKYEYKRQISRNKNKTLRPLWFLFPGLGGQWSAMAKAFMPIKTFSDKIEECHQILSEFGIDLKQLLLTEDKSVISTMSAKFCATTALQIALFEVMKSLDITSDGIIGHSFGEIACAYADGCLSTRDAMIVTFFRGFDSEIEKNIGTGLMAVCALNKFEAKKLIPPEIVIACYNSKNSVVLSGPKKPMKQIIENLKQKIIFCHQLDSNGIPFHSKYMKDSAQPMNDHIKQYLKNPKKRTDKWISTSIIDKKPNEEILKYASAEYFVNNLISSVYFYDQLKKLPSNAIVVEISSDAVFKRIVGQTLESATYLSLMKKDSNDTNLVHFLSSIATLYELGLNPFIEKLYPKVVFPVSRGTPSISSLMKWDHSVKYPLRLYPEYFNKSTESDINVTIDINELDNRFYEEHTMDGNILFPAAGYIMLAWRALSAAQGKTWNEVPVIFEDIHFKRAVHLSNENKTSLKVLYDRKSGNFSIRENDEICCSGRICSKSEEILYVQKLIEEKQNTFTENEFSLEADDIYKEFKIRGYHFSREFRKLKQFNTKDFKHFNGIVEWNCNPVAFLDAILHSIYLVEPIRRLLSPVMIKSLRIDPKVMLNALAHNRMDNQIENELNINSIEERFCLFPSELPFYYNPNQELLVSPGIEFENIISKSINRRVETKNLVLDSYEFLSNDDNNAIEEYDKRHINEYLQLCESMSTQIKQTLLKNIKCDLNYENQTKDFIERYRHQTNEKHIIIKFLDKLYNSLQKAKNNAINITQEYIQSIINELQESKEYDLENDLLNTVSNNERLIRSLTDIVSENNVTKRELKVTEINLSSDLFVNEVMKNISNFETFPTVVNYELIVKSIEDVNENLHEHCHIWNTEYLPINSSDLILLRDTQQIWELSLEDIFQKIISSLVDNGFLIIVIKYKLTQSELALKTILMDNNKNKHLVGNSDFENRLKQINDISEQMGLKLIGNKCDSIATKALLFRKIGDKKEIPTNDQIIEIKAERSEEWFELIKNKLINTKENNRDIWLIARDSNINGIIGLINCLRYEPNGLKIRCIFDFDHKTILPIDWNSKPFSDILRNDLMINVIKDGKLGTYRHLRLPKDYEKIVSNEYFLNFTQIGDLSSLQWFDCRRIVANKEKYGLNNDIISQVFVKIYCSGLVYRDVLVATGHINDELQYLSPNSVIGWEYAGRRADTGKRVMGCQSNGCFATNIDANIENMTTIPEHWSMEDSITILIVYQIAWYSLIERANIKQGESILIHSGTGGVGQAVINICKHYECDIYVTVGSEEKKLFLINEYNIPENRIFSSKNNEFKYKIKKITDGKGVDIVVNSLGGELLEASIDCINKVGRFIQLGKVDRKQNKQLGTYDFLRDITFIGVTLDLCIRENKEIVRKFFDWMHRNATNGCVKSINRKVFEANEVEKAFRYMTTGKHIGKIVIKMRDEEDTRMSLINTKPAQEMLTTTKTYFNQNKVYIITGGLGGIGLELVQWMSNKGAKKFVLTSRSGIKNNYQKYVINRMIKFGEYMKYFKVEIHISKNDCLTVESTRRVITEASQMGQIGGIFHLTLILNDCLLENMSFEKFCESIDTKHKVCANFDDESRKLGYNLDYFVVFSSISCGKGAPGQSNYGFGSSLCERICEQRRRDSLHGLAIQLGPVDDVGAAGNLDQFVSVSTIQKQRINYFCDILDKLLPIRQSVVTSHVLSNIVKKKAKSKTGIIENLWNILGIDPEYTSDDKTLWDIGMESLFMAEFQQQLEKTFGVKYTNKEILNFSIRFLKRLEKDCSLQQRKS